MDIHKYNSKGELVEPWEDGYFSVTTILDVRHKQKLWDWKLRVGYEEAHNRMLEAQEKGKAIHAMAEQFFNGNLPASVEKYLQPYYNALVRWSEKYKPSKTLTEYYLVSNRHGYAGTADLICRLKDGNLWIIDLKTGGKSIDHGLQLAAYRHAYQEMTGVRAKTACLYLTDKTKRGWSWKEYKEPVGVFLAAKKLFDWQIKHEPFKKPKPEQNYTGGMIYVEEAV